MILWKHPSKLIWVAKVKPFEMRVWIPIESLKSDEHGAIRVIVSWLAVAEFVAQDETTLGSGFKSCVNVEPDVISAQVEVCKEIAQHCLKQYLYGLDRDVRRAMERLWKE